MGAGPKRRPACLRVEVARQVKTKVSPSRRTLALALALAITLTCERGVRSFRCR